jgi:hypothetical protein
MMVAGVGPVLHRLSGYDLPIVWPRLTETSVVRQGHPHTLVSLVWGWRRYGLSCRQQSVSDSQPPNKIRPSRQRTHALKKKDSKQTKLDQGVQCNILFRLPRKDLFSTETSITIANPLGQHRQATPTSSILASTSSDLPPGANPVKEKPGIMLEHRRLYLRGACPAVSRDRKRGG